MVLARVGAIPPERMPPRRETFTNAVRELGRRADHRGVRLAIETGAEPGEKLAGIPDRSGCPRWPPASTRRACCKPGVDPVAAVRAGGWVAHAYANDATGTSRGPAPNPRGFGFPPGALDWEEFLGAFEEIGYHGFLTVWPSPGRPAAAQFSAISQRLKRLG